MGWCVVQRRRLAAFTGVEEPGRINISSQLVETNGLAHTFGADNVAEQQQWTALGIAA